MAKKNPNIFLYQINFNKEKYPEVCDRLEEMKEAPGGIAWYLRKLIAQDIQNERESHTPSLMDNSLPIFNEQKQRATTVAPETTQATTRQQAEKPQESESVAEHTSVEKEEAHQNLKDTGGFEF